MKKLAIHLLFAYLLFYSSCTPVDALTEDCDTFKAPEFIEYADATEVTVNESAELTLSPANLKAGSEVRWELPGGGRQISPSLELGPMTVDMAGTYTMTVGFEGCWDSRTLDVKFKKLEAGCDLKPGTLYAADGDDSTAYELEGVSIKTHMNGEVRYTLLFDGWNSTVDFVFKQMPEPGEYDLEFAHYPNDPMAMTMLFDFGRLQEYQPNNVSIGSLKAYLRMDNGERRITFCNVHASNTRDGEVLRMYGDFLLAE